MYNHSGRPRARTLKGLVCKQQKEINVSRFLDAERALWSLIFHPNADETAG